MPTIIDQVNFETEYKKLNQQQRQAVDAIEGPIMIVAGAGTGKTQTIALRIANILQKTQTPPHGILCLTFTENAAINMRERLQTIIGPLAYNVKIHTFHSFCNEVIKTNPEHFIFAQNIESLEELEKIEIIRELIDNLPEGSQLKPWGDPYYYQRDIISSIQSLKRENISPKKFFDLIKEQEKFLKNTKDQYSALKALRIGKTIESELMTIVENLKKESEKFKAIYSLINLNHQLYLQGHFDIGLAKNPAVNFKNALIKIFDNFEKDTPRQLELHQIFIAYQQELQRLGRYDFDDMILFVLDAFREDQELLLAYQERFQYVLVDEYQDTNSAQNQILDLLGSYFDDPNIFVVGDDDQSIFRFQGASIENIYEFYQKYKKSIKVIVLKNNYRSHQLILDTSASVINYNKNRIVNYIENIDKSLVSISTYDPNPVNFYEGTSALDENYFIAKKIEELTENGTSPREIAVLFRNNSDADDLVETFENKGIKFHLESGTNALDHPRIKQLIRLLTYINDPTDSESLFHLLSYDFIKINSFDLYRILQYSHRHQLPLSELISSPHLLSQINGIKKNTLIRLKNFSIRTAKAIHWLKYYNLDRFFNRTIRKFGYLSHIVALNDLELINYLNAFYNEIKRFSVKKETTLSDFLERIELFIDNKIPLIAQELISDSENSIRLMTVHKAKGLEFEHVFLTKCTDRKWGNNYHASPLRLPSGILKTEISRLAHDENEDERRLFYVALTRAKKQIYISYSRKTETGRDQLPSIFIAEIKPDLIEKISPQSQSQQEAIFNAFPLDSKKPIKNIELSSHLKDQLKKNYKLNVTHLNSYLECPLCFYYKTILRIPSIKDKYAALGTAVHYSLSHLFNVLGQQGKLISKKDLLTFYEQALKREDLSQKNFKEALHRGTESLSEYYDHYQSSFSGNCVMDYDCTPRHLFVDDIPITGKIDKIEIQKTTRDGKPAANLVDFKTGNPDTKSKDMQPGGSYHNQIVFYKILTDSDPEFPYHVSTATIDFIQKSKYKKTFIRRDFEFRKDDIDIVKKLIKEIYEKIINLDFNHIGEECKDEQDLHGLLE